MYIWLYFDVVRLVLVYLCIMWMFFCGEILLDYLHNMHMLCTLLQVICFVNQNGIFVSHQLQRNQAIVGKMW
jgi:hypothetical protein